MGKFRPTEQQLKAIRRLDGPVFIAAGAGSGKTGVITFRFVEAIANGIASVDEILTITFTIKAAAEMMERIRGNLHRRELAGAEPDDRQKELMAQAYRDIERARISTIDSFCASVLRANAMAAGIDPGFAVADPSRAQIIREEAFDACLARFVDEQAAGDSGHLAEEFISAYDERLEGKLFGIITSVYDILRSRGQRAELPVRPVDIKGKEERLGQAARELVAAIDRGGKSGKKTALDLLDAVGTALGVSGEDEIRDKLTLVGGIKPSKGKLKGFEGEFQAFQEALKGYTNELRSALAAGTLMLFDKLLKMFDWEYSDLKEQHNVLDFGDLGLRTRDLLRDHEPARRWLSSRFKLIMVDEFQDTNPLQHELIRLLSRDGANLCVVGDENQSIYGFRDAEVDLFRFQNRAAKEAGYQIELRDNFRSHGDILAFVDHLFDREGMIEEGYLRLEPRAEPDGRDDDTRVEIIFVDESRKCKEEGLERVKVEVTRPAEAQLIAERLRELYDTEQYSAGDTAMLFMKRRDADIYRRALEGAGIRSYLAIGVSYFQKLEFVDVLNLLRLIINPLDDQALLGVLRSPMVAISDDTLYRLRLLRDESTSRPGQPLWPLLSDGASLSGVDEAERERLAVFAADLGRMRLESRGQNLRRTVRKALEYNGYDTVIAARGRQELANLIKLSDLAADFESAWGNDLAAFAEFLERQKAVQAREAEAPVEEEGVDAVRIMTMHMSKGLEFPLVVLPKLGADPKGRKDDTDLVLERDPDSGDRVRSVGAIFRTTDTSGNLTGRAFEYEEIEKGIAKREAEELRRLHYVAMTRAMSHLILAGTAAADKTTLKDWPFNWIRDTFSLSREERGNLDELQHVEGPGGIRIGFTLCSEPRAALERYEKAEGAVTKDQEVEVDTGIAEMPPASIFVPSRVSPTALDTFRACPRRYYLENVLHVGELAGAGAGFGVRTGPGEGGGGGWQPAAEGGDLDRAQMGTLVHAILEKADFTKPGALAVDAARLNELARSELGAAAEVNDHDIGLARSLLERFENLETSSEIIGAAAAGKLERELDFSTMIGPSILAGKIDALIMGEEGTTVVDYKTGSPAAGGTPEDTARKYEYQMAAYALAAGRMHPGPVKVALMFLGGDGYESIESYRSGDAAALEERLKEVIDSMADGRFEAPEELDRNQCYICAAGPNGARLCRTPQQPPRIA